MDRCKSSTRLSSIESPVILTQTDTTVGFLSKDDKKLYTIKSRNTSKPFIKVYRDFKTFSLLQNRVPKKYKKLVRNSKKTTFIVKSKAFRVAKNNLNSKVLNDLDWSFSTSANESSKKFDLIFCENKSDIIIQNKEGLYESQSSTLLKLSNKKIRRLR